MPASMQDVRGGERAHMGAGAGAVGDVDRVGEAPERGRLAQQVLRVAGDRRRDLRGHDKTAGPQPLGKACGAGVLPSFMQARCKHASEKRALIWFAGALQLRRWQRVFWTENTRPARELPQ